MLTIIEPQIVSSQLIALNEVQRTAIKLYDFGLNVVPIPTPEQIWAQPGMDPNEKRKFPFFKELFFSGGLHRCNSYCFERERRTGHKCLQIFATFEELVRDCNISLMTGRTSGNLVSADCDTQRSFEYVVNEFIRRSYPVWAWTSHDGRGHVAFRLADGEAANCPNSAIPDVNIIGNRHYAVCPPSIHWSGELYTWIGNKEPTVPPPTLHLEEVQFMGVMLDRVKKAQWQEPELNGLKEWTILLSRPNRHIAASPIAKGTRNKQLTKLGKDIAAHVILGNVSEFEGRDLFNECGENCNYSAKALQSMWKSIMDSNPTPANAHYKNQENKHINEWEAAEAFAEDYDWQGRPAQTDRAVFLACCRRSMLDGRDLFRATWRELKEIANVGSFATIQKSLKRLQDMKLIHYVTSDKGNGAAIYKFPDEVVKIGKCAKVKHDIRQEGGIMLHLCTPLSHQEQDVFKGKRVAYRAWQHLKETPNNVSDTARATKQTRSSVSRGIQFLLAYNLVTKGEHGIYTGLQATDAQLVAVATSRGTLGYSQNRKLEHIRQREIRINLKLYEKESAWFRNWNEKRN